jgi:hypothetical protein
VHQSANPARRTLAKRPERSTLAASFVLAAFAWLALAACSSMVEQQATRELEIDVVIDPSALRSGTYVDIVLDSAGPEAPRESWALPIVPRVIEANSLAVDVVAGATTSSKAILKAIENALRAAPLR